MLSKGPHFEAKSGGNRNGVVEDVSDVRDIEARLEVLLELGFPVGIAEIDGGALLRGPRRRADLLGGSAGIPSQGTRIQARKSMIRALRIAARESEFGADRVRESAHRNRTEITRQPSDQPQCGSLDCRPMIELTERTEIERECDRQRDKVEQQKECC